VTPPSTEVLHGWTLADLSDLAATVAARHRHWWPAGDIADQHAAAWEGITWHLCEAQVPPARNDLLAAGLRSLAAHVAGERRHQGRGAHNASANAGAKFSAYWDWHSAPAPDPAARITERLAVAQILPALTPRQREALTLLAAYGDYQDAAAAMGVATGTFEVHIKRARKAFLALWHEGETPSRQWRRDKRVFSRTPREAALAECGTMRAVWQHKRRGEFMDQACRDARNAYNRGRYEVGMDRAAGGQHAAVA
jgi:sigma-70-like protein